MMKRQSGFTIVEFVIASALMIALMAVLFTALQASQDANAVQSEAADVLQRARIATDNLTRDLMSASGVRPYRSGVAAPDPPGTFRSDTLTSVGDVATTYWLKSDLAAGTYQLMTCTGATGNDVPIVDQIVELAFGYVGDGGTLLDPTQFTDGPWRPDAVDAGRWDADLDRVRAVRVLVRVQSAIAALRGPAGALFTHAGTAISGQKWVPDLVIHFVVALRNIGE